MKSIAVIGSTGAVGRKLIDLLEKRNFPIKKIRFFASEKSVGKTIEFKHEKILIERLSIDSLQGVDLAFFAAGSLISKEWIPRCKNILCIDSSSYFRMDPRVPLVIPEINSHALKKHQGIIASPNCTATVLLLPLAPLHERFRAKRIILTTYQAASGGGYQLQELLRNETKAFLEGKKIVPTLSYPYAFNLYTHNSKLHESGYVEEELKILEESRKILEDETLQISATCVRVPILQAHSVSANIEFEKPASVIDAEKLIANAPGVLWFSDSKSNRFATPFDATNRDEIFCGRLRKDHSHPNALEFWAVGDQLLKGAALNAFQIAEKLNVTRAPETG